MFERFTTRARRGVILAQEEARKLEHNFIGSEHILLGVLRVIDGPVRTLLNRLGVTTHTVRQAVTVIVGSGRSQPAGHIPFTPGGRLALTSALHSALRLGDNDIDVEHILLGLLDLPDTVDRVALRALTTLGVDVATLRHQVTEAVAASPRPEDST